MGDKKIYFQWIIISFLFIILLAAIIFTRPSATNQIKEMDLEKLKALASELYNQELYKQAIEKYREYLSKATIDLNKQANIHYIIANIYMDKIKDYEAALAEYITVKYLNPGTDLLNELNKRIVEALERLQRSLDAQNVLDETTRMAGSAQAEKPKKGELVAMIGNKQITMGDIEDALEKLPPYVREQFNTPEKKLEFLHQYLATELLYNTAQRKGYDRDPEITAQAYEFKKAAMAQKLYKEEITDKIKVSDNDAELYYQAHPEEFTEPEARDISHIQLTSKKEAEEVLKLLKKGENFEKLAKDRSTDFRTRDKGGKLGMVKKDGYIPGIGASEAFLNAAFKLNKGEFSDIVETDKGFHIIKVNSITPPRTLSFIEAKESAKAKLAQIKEKQAFEELFQRMVKAEEVKIYEDVFLSEAKKVK